MILWLEGSGVDVAFRRGQNVNPELNKLRSEGGLSREVPWAIERDPGADTLCVMPLGDPVNLQPAVLRVLAVVEALPQD